MAEFFVIDLENLGPRITAATAADALAAVADEREILSGRLAVVAAEQMQVGSITRPKAEMAVTLGDANELPADPA